MLISASDLLNKSIALYRDNAQLFLSYMLWLYAPTALTLIATIVPLAFSSTKTLLVVAVQIVSFLILIATTLMSIWISLAFVRAIAKRYTGLPAMTIKEELRSVRSLIFPFIFASILLGLAVVGGFILLVVPGIIFAVWFGFIEQALVLDDKHGIDALSHSKHLVKGRWWSVWWRLVVASVVFGVFVLLAQYIISSPFQLLSQSLPFGSPIALAITGIGGLLGAAAGLFFTPCAVAAQTILYIELKQTPREAN